MVQRPSTSRPPPARASPPPAASLEWEGVKKRGRARHKRHTNEKLNNPDGTSRKRETTLPVTECGLDAPPQPRQRPSLVWSTTQRVRRRFGGGCSHQFGPTNTQPSRTEVQRRASSSTGRIRAPFPRATVPRHAPTQTESAGVRTHTPASKSKNPEPSRPPQRLGAQPEPCAAT